MEVTFFVAIVAVIFGVIYYAVKAIINKLSDKKKFKIALALNIIEDFIKNNQGLISQPWSIVKEKIQNLIEQPINLKFGDKVVTIKIDLTDEEWDLIWKKAYETYIKLKNELQDQGS